jgi:hypothetical protein
VFQKVGLLQRKHGRDQHAAVLHFAEEMSKGQASLIEMQKSRRSSERPTVERELVHAVPGKNMKRLVFTSKLYLLEYEFSHMHKKTYIGSKPGIYCVELHC